MKTLNEHLKKKTFKNVYLLYGDEAYLRIQYRDRLRDALINEGDTMNMASFEGKGIDEKEVMALADTMPFFSDYRLIIIENSGFFTSSHDELAEYMKHIPETTCIVFVEADVDKRNKLFKAVSAAGYAANLTIPNDKQLILWLAGMVKRENKLIQEPTLQYFLQLVEHDMNCMRQEMEKLLCYVGERQIIEKTDVDAVCSVFVENKIFDMIRAVSEKNQRQALQLYDDLVTLKEAPMRILYLIIKQFNTLYEIRDLAVKGYPAGAIAEKTGIRDFIVKRNIALGRNFDLPVLRQAVEDGTELEEAVKTGRITDRLAVEWMIQKYSH
ncbi:MAG: DNA polymerase III subunit delta [Coprococcus sp.]